MKQLFVIALLVLALTAGTAYAGESATAQYICPMHPQVISNMPDDKCPICGMDLVMVDGDEHHHGISAPVQTEAERKVLYWYDPMKPGTKFDKPGKSPFMDMQLVPKYADDPGTEEAGAKPVISISAETVQKMGVRTEKAVKGSFGQAIRATGIVMPNERTRFDIFSQVEGRVGDLKYAVGDLVKKGEVFYMLVSPELATLQSDYLVALSGGMKDMSAAARNRMMRLGIDAVTLDTLTRTRKSFEGVPFHIPADGILAKLDIRNGHYLKAGDEIGHIQDLSVVWIEAAVAERDATTIKAGDAAQVTHPDSAKICHATVDYIYPTVNAEARTVKVRLLVENKDGVLRPDSYATVEFAANISERVTVPSEAVLRGGSGNRVIIPLGEGKFQVRSVTTGIVSGGRTEILSGIREGEGVVVSSQFMIDSESSLRESLQKFDTPGTEGAGMEGMDHGK